MLRSHVKRREDITASHADKVRRENKIAGKEAGLSDRIGGGASQMMLAGFPPGLCPFLDNAVWPGP